MRNTQSDLEQLDMNCDGGEKYINGEQGQGEDELGSANNASDADATADEADGHRGPEAAHGADGEDLEDPDLENGEFSALNSALDELQGALDNLESRNDGIHQELLQLLQSNREIRTNIMEENGRAGGASSDEPQDGAVASSSRGIRCLANDLLSDLPSIAKLDLGGPPPEPIQPEGPSPSSSNATAQSSVSVMPDLIASASGGACGGPN